MNDVLKQEDRQAREAQPATVRPGLSGLPVKTPSFFLLMEDYQDAYSRAAEADPEFRHRSFAEASRMLFTKGIYYGDAWVNALQTAGCVARQTVPICLPLQYKWARENGVPLPPSFVSRIPFRWYWQLRHGMTPTRHTLWRIVEEQLAREQPDCAWVFSGVEVSREQLRRWRRHTRRLLLWWNCATLPDFPYEEFDLILSGVSERVKQFRERGLTAAHLAHAFDHRILERLPVAGSRTPTVAFIGKLSGAHLARTRFLDALARQVALEFYGGGTDCLPADSPLRARAHPAVWGDAYYRLHGSLLVVLHKPADHEAGQSSAKRLFEATGMGACLVTEHTDDLREYFEPDREVVTYHNLEECVEKVKYLLAHPAEAAAIGQRGQARTLRDHTYARRARQLLDMLESRS